MVLFNTQSCSPAVGCKHLVRDASDFYFLNWQVSVGFSDVSCVQHIIKENILIFKMHLPPTPL